MNNKFLGLNDISSYSLSNDISNRIWVIVINWPIFARKTVCEQIVKAVDSISANIAEGFGRYFKRDKVKFYYYARASVIETLTWLEKSFKRRLISKEEYFSLRKGLEILPRDINSLINFTYKNLKK
jgi:four helix bundle protein